MKANELMIGDWVSQSNGNAVKIDWIKTGEYGYYDKYGKMEIACTPLLEPIPLTPEILYKNRWKEMPNGTICLYDKFDNSKSIICDKGLVFTFLDRTFKLIYVHELQNALRLCGLNDLADNFKL